MTIHTTAENETLLAGLLGVFRLLSSSAGIITKNNKKAKKED